jgi:hypothetical protein
VVQQRHLSMIVLELLADIIPFRAGNSIFGTRLVLHIMANCAVAFDTTTASATVDDEILDSVAVSGGFPHDLGRWSDKYKIRAFRFSKMYKSASIEHPSTLRSINNLVLLLRDQRRYGQTEKMRRKILGLRETVLGKRILTH